MMRKAMIGLLMMTSPFSYSQTCKQSIPFSAPDSRYQLMNNNAEVKDLQTGLIWQRCSLGQVWNGTTCVGSTVTYTWLHALQLAKNMGGEWRLPNVTELTSLIEQACYDPAINARLFPNTTSFDYWSSSPVASSSRAAWIVGFYYGYANYGAKYESFYVRLVRSSQ